MSRHFDDAPGLCEQPDPETQSYVFNHTMMRIKDPAAALDFYTRVLGMRLLRRLDFEELNFTLYFLGVVPDAEASAIPADPGERNKATFGRQAVLELTHNWGSENDPELRFHNGNDSPQGYGHVGFAVPDIHAACKRFEALGVDFIKRPEDGKIKDIAFIRDPDGYWVEVFEPARMGGL